MKISAIRSVPEEGKMGGESNDSDSHSQYKSSKKARKNKRSTSTSASTVLKTTSDSEESECDEREKLKVKKRFIKAKLLSSPPPITLTLKKTSTQTDSGAFLGESSNAHDNNSYLSSSDNELPALVNAAIKCVESDSGSNTEVTPAKMTQQYTSSLLQDYMEKTQLLAQDPVPTNKDKKVKEVVKRKRGRPKKNTSLVLETDSGVASTAQSSSPSPKTSVATTSNLKKSISTISLDKKSFLADSLASPYRMSPSNRENQKPKIDIVSLDKKMYATERTLYPPPRSKKVSNQHSVLNSSSLTTSIKNKLKEESVTLDPIWRKIDVNLKFRRPSLSGYKSDGGGVGTCSKVLAAKSGYVSDYGNVRTAKNKEKEKDCSGYKSDASFKSRCSSIRSCSKVKKYKRKRDRTRSLFGNASSAVDQDQILQLAGLSLGQSSEESNEYLNPSTSKKLEINRFVNTGEYFGKSKTPESLNKTNNNKSDLNSSDLNNLDLNKSQKSSKPETQRNGSVFGNLADLDLPRKIKFRRSSAASYCSSYYSGTSKCHSKKKRRKSGLYRNSTGTYKNDPKLNSDIESIINSFSLQCRIQTQDQEGNKSSKNNNQKKSLKKRKENDNTDSGNTPSTSGNSSKRRHKKTTSSSPDDHKLPLKKRHYLLTPGEKSDASMLLLKTIENSEPSGTKKRHRETVASETTPSIFQQSLELQIQIPNKLTDSIITKAEVESPLEPMSYPSPPKTERVESLLIRSNASFLNKRKRKKINRTGFPTAKKKRPKPKVERMDDQDEEASSVLSSPAICERVPEIGEASDSFVQRQKPRLSVVSLERLQSPLSAKVMTRRKSLHLQEIAKKESLSPPLRIMKRRATLFNPKPLEPESDDSVDNMTLAKRFRVLKDRATNFKQPKRESLPVTLTEKIKARLREKTKTPELPQIKPVVVEEKVGPRRPGRPPKVKVLEPEMKEHLEQEPLPIQEAIATDTESIFSDISSESSSSKSRKDKLKKNYLVAGLFSDYFKTSQKKKIIPVSSEDIKSNVNLLPPPPYCERYFRRTQQDFKLPYDIWHAHINSKLPTKVASWNFKKLRTNVYAPDCRPNTANIDHPTCNCKPNIGCADDCLNKMVYTECYPSTCPNKDKCKNQKIQRHDIAPGVERFMTANKGYGVMTKKKIEKGTYILEYVGEVVNEKVFKERMNTIYLNDKHHYCLHLDGGLVIDGHRMGSDCRFVNHSCQPNCEMQKWSVNGLSRMALFASRVIQPGEELTYDYNFSLFNPAEGQPCRCETPLCRGVIGGKSQRIKPIEVKTKAHVVEEAPKSRNNRKKPVSKKNLPAPQRGNPAMKLKDVINPQLQPLTEKEKKILKIKKCFLRRNLEKVQRLKGKQTPSPLPIIETSKNDSRPMTPSTLAVQISAIRTPRNIKTRCLTQTDPEVERMAKVALSLKDICSSLEAIKDVKTDKPLISRILVGNKKKGKPITTLDFNTIQRNIEKGYYKEAISFDDDMRRLFTVAKEMASENPDKSDILDNLLKIYDVEWKKHAGDFGDPNGFVFAPEEDTKEDIIGCICGLYNDEGLMIQCNKCLIWQHSECTKADINADYMCQRCDPHSKIDMEICLNETSEEGFKYHLALLRGKLQIRQGDAVYVLRDIPVKDTKGNVIPAKKHNYQTIGDIDYSECDIFRVERLWKNKEGKRFIFGHHYLRPHETFHEPSRKFYPNEVVRVPLFEVVPIDLVMERCWVFDRATYCKGRPVECNDEQHVYICELKVDKTARFFSKAKRAYPTCTKTYAFRKFAEKLKISKTYAPHEVDPSFLKLSRRVKKEDSISAGSVRSDSLTPISSRGRKVPSPTQIIQVKPFNEKRANLEKVLETMKGRKFFDKATKSPPVNLTYMVTGRGGRHRKTIVPK
ncbi:ASH1L family protein [Megaselia abdita]